MAHHRRRPHLLLAHRLEVLELLLELELQQKRKWLALPLSPQPQNHYFLGLFGYWPA